MITVHNVRGEKVKIGTVMDLKRVGFSWGDCLNPTKEDLQTIEKFTHIPESVLRDALEQRERPKALPVGNASMIILRSATKKGDKARLTNVVLIILKEEVITLHTEDIAAITDLLSATSEKKLALFGKNVTDLTFTLFNEILKDYFNFIDELEDKIDELEIQILEKTNHDTIKRIFHLKKTLIFYHKALTANREVISDIEKGFVREFKKDKIIRFRELYHDIAELIDITATYRDILTGLIDIHLSNTSNNLNVIIKRLTVYGSFILVPTLIASIYGMNFKNMPEIGWYHGYYISIVLMILSIIAMYTLFKKEKWI